jgi:glycosyltransferase involved in cell wall biosynthesis
MEDKPKFLYLVTEGWYFYSHRLPMARAARRAGFDVAVITDAGNVKEKIEAEGIRVIDFNLDRRSLNVFKAIGHIARITSIYRQEKPDMVHHIAMKPIVYGSIAARITKVSCVINAFAGLGYVFSSKTGLANVLRPVLLLLFRFLLKRKNSYLLFQNKDDYSLLDGCGLVVEERARIIRGSGVDTDEYPLQEFNEPDDGVICAFAGRMIDIKGLPTLKEAFEQLSVSAPYIKLWLCGKSDPDNPVSWSEERLLEWEANSDNVEWKRHCNDMVSIWKEAHIALQPSYGGEGVPKALLEAASCGRAIVATDVPGCREVVHDGENGFLVPPYDAHRLANEIALLANNPERCRKMGIASRKIVESDLSADSVSKATEQLYRDCYKRASAAD